MTPRIQRLRVELLEKGNAQANLLRAVWDRSRDVSLQRYEKSVYDAGMAMALYNKNSRALSSRQLSVFKALHAWRDGVARQEDESCRYVLPDHQLFELADVQPREIPQVLACCKPVPPVVRISAHIIIQVISSATLDISDAPAKKAWKTEEDDLISREEDAAAAAAAAAAAIRRKKVPIGELLLPAVVHTAASVSLVASFLESSCVAQAFDTVTSLDAVKPDVVGKVEHATTTFLKDSLLAQLISAQGPREVQIPEGLKGVEGGRGDSSGGSAVVHFDPAAAATHAAAEAASDADAAAAAAAAAKQAAKPACVAGTGNDGILRLSTMKRANSDSKRKRSQKKKGGGSLSNTPKKNTPAKSLDDGEKSLSKTAMKKKRKKEAAANAAQTSGKQPAGGGSFNPYGM